MIPEMPSRWRIWRGAMMWMLGCCALVWVLPFGIHLYALLFTPQTYFFSPTTLPFLTMLSGVGLLAGLMVALLNSRDDLERQQLVNGRANRAALQYLAKRPSVLMIQRNLAQLWEEAVKRIPEEEKREMESEARERRVRALLATVPDAIVDYRGGTLRWYLGEILTALDAFVSDGRALQEVGFERFYLLYEQVMEAIARQLAEDVGLDSVVTPRLSEGKQLRKLEVFLTTFDVQLDRVVDGVLVDVHVHSDAPATLRRAINHILTDKE